MSDRCDACGRTVRVAGGIANLWTFSSTPTEGMTLTFDSDGSEHFLCFDCIDRLPDDPTADDVAAIGDDGATDPADAADAGQSDGAETAGSDAAEAAPTDAAERSPSDAAERSPSDAAERSPSDAAEADADDS